MEATLAPGRKDGKRKNDGEAGETRHDNKRTALSPARMRLDEHVPRASRHVVFAEAATVHVFKVEPEPGRAALENQVRCLIESTQFGPVLGAQMLSVDDVCGNMDSQTLATFATALVAWRDAVLDQ